MRHLQQCSGCHQLTTLSLCPRCDAATTPYAADAAAEHDAWHTEESYARQSFAELSLADVEAIATCHGSPIYAPGGPSQQPADGLAMSVTELESENEALKSKLEGNRRQMLRSAMAVRQLYASTRRQRQRDQDMIDELRRVNAHLHEQLIAAAAQAPQQSPSATEAQPLLTAARVTETSPPAPAPAAAAAAAPSVPPLNLRFTAPVAPVEKEPESGLAFSTPLRSPDKTHASSIVDDAPALKSEVARLRGAVVRKTQQLDGLWERVERAERYILELLAQLNYAQDLTQEETRNSARLSRHLANLGEPPADMAAFMALKDRRGASRTPTSSCAPSSVGLRGAGSAPAGNGSANHHEAGRR